MLIAGDLFHRQPLLRELREVDYLFSTLTRTQVVLVAGNHDYIGENSRYRTFSWSRNVRMIRSREISFVELEQLDTAVYGMSYWEREIAEPLYERVQIRDGCRFHLLLAHGGDARHLPFRRAEVDAIGFDYVALGHIHRPQELIPGRMAYAGALEPVDKNDTGKHGMIEGELDERGCRISFVPFARREYIHLEIPVRENMTGYALRSEIRRSIEEQGTDNLYRVTLTGERDPETQFDLEQMDSYGNLIEIADYTAPALDFPGLLARNRDNLLGRYIAEFAQARPGSVEYQALCEGVLALLKTKRG